jgi:hypothetical protein
MWLLTIKDKQTEGAYAVPDEYGDKVLFLFEQEDDAERYAMMINEQDTKRQMDIIEVEDELALKTCRMYNYKYAVITPDDIVIPPKNDNV